VHMICLLKFIGHLDLLLFGEDWKDSLFEGICSELSLS
jgi:hypothetical protein